MLFSKTKGRAINRTCNDGKVPTCREYAPYVNEGHGAIVLILEMSRET